MAARDEAGLTVELALIGFELERQPAVVFRAAGFGGVRCSSGCERRFVEPLLDLAKRRSVPAALIGRVGGSRLSISPWIDAPVDDLSDAWRTGLTNAMMN